MSSRRDAIKMSDAEALAFLEGERTVICATNGKDGWPHLMPLWFVVRDGRLWAWTFAKSQKVANLARDPRATLQVEAGEEYAQLRGLMLETEVRVHGELDVVLDLGLEIMARYAPAGSGTPPEGAREAVAAQAAKRVGLEFVEARRTSFDHRKLGGTY